jgi:hypothetical protein
VNWQMHRSSWCSQQLLTCPQPTPAHGLLIWVTCIPSPAGLQHLFMISSSSLCSVFHPCRAAAGRRATRTQRTRRNTCADPAAPAAASAASRRRAAPPVRLLVLPLTYLPEHQWIASTTVFGWLPPLCNSTSKASAVLGPDPPKGIRGLVCWHPSGSGVLQVDRHHTAPSAARPVQPAATLSYGRGCVCRRSGCTVCWPRAAAWSGCLQPHAFVSSPAQP